MPPRSFATYEFTSVARWLSPLLWGFTLFLLIFIAGRSASGWTPEPTGGLTLFATSLALSLWAAWLHRRGSEQWSAEKELLNSGITLLPVTLIGFFTLATNSTFSVFATVVGIVLAGGWQIYQAGDVEVAPEDDRVSSGMLSLDDSVTLLSQTTGAAQKAEPVSQLESTSESSVEAREQKTFDISRLGESEPEGLSDMDTRVIEIPEEILHLNHTEPTSTADFQTNGQLSNGHPTEAPPESCCSETDRSYDLFAEQTEWVVQQFRRTRRPSGCEAIEGYMKIEWEAGQRRQVVHVPFYPPFAERPEIYCESEDETEVRLKVADVRRYGARIELALPHTAIAGESTCLHLLACVEVEKSDAPQDRSEINEAPFVSHTEQNGTAGQKRQGTMPGIRPEV